MTKELVAFVVKQLVQHPDEVQIAITQTDDQEHIHITVSDQDRGKVIGKEGQIIKAIRMLANAASSAEKKILVDVAR